MSIRIERRTSYEGASVFWCEESNRYIGPRYTTYLVIVDGRRVDSFLHKRNALAKARKLKEIARV